MSIASENYPRAPMTGRPITGLEDFSTGADLMLFHAGTAHPAGRWATAGGRVLGVTAWGPDTTAARHRAYEGVSRIRFNGMHYRRDIAGEILAIR